MARVLFLSARVGLGHTAAAGAIGSALAAGGIGYEVVDSYRYAASMFAKVVSDGYLGMVKAVPQMYGMIYDRAERAQGAGAARRWISRLTAHRLEPVIRERRADLVVCTHAFPCGVMSAYKRHIDPSIRVAGVVTDFVVHPYWIYDNVDDYTVATPAMRAQLLARGVRADHVHADGIPVDRRFGESADRAALRERLGLPGHVPLVLVMGGGLGMGPLEDVVDALARADLPIGVVVLAGENRRLAARLCGRTRDAEHVVRIVEYVENVYDYMHACDVLVTKPGGLSTAEAMAAELPTILMRPLPGQEQRNASYLLSHGAALDAGDPDRVAMLVERVLSDRAVRVRLRAGMRMIGRPHSATIVAARYATTIAAPARERTRYASGAS